MMLVKLQIQRQKQMKAKQQPRNKKQRAIEGARG